MSVEECALDGLPTAFGPILFGLLRYYYFFRLRSPRRRRRRDTNLLQKRMS